MNCKKGLTLVMAVGIAAGVLAGCGSDTSSDKKVFDVWCGNDLSAV